MTISFTICGDKRYARALHELYDCVGKVGQFDGRMKRVRSVSVCPADHDPEVRKVVIELDAISPEVAQLYPPDDLNELLFL